MFSSAEVLLSSLNKSLEPLGLFISEIKQTKGLRDLLRLLNNTLADENIKAVSSKHV